MDCDLRKVAEDHFKDGQLFRDKMIKAESEIFNLAALLKSTERRQLAYDSMLNDIKKEVDVKLKEALDKMAKDSQNLLTEVKAEVSGMRTSQQSFLFKAFSLFGGLQILTSFVIWLITK